MFNTIIHFFKLHRYKRLKLHKTTKIKVVKYSLNTIYKI